MTRRARITCIAATAALAAVGAPTATAIGVPAGPAPSSAAERSPAATSVEWGDAGVGIVVGTMLGLALAGGVNATRRLHAAA